MNLLFVKIQTIIKTRHISQAEFSRRIQVSPQRYSKWLHGTGEPGPTTLLRIARVLNLTMESLVDDQLVPAPPATLDHLDPFMNSRESEGLNGQPLQNPQEARSWPTFNKLTAAESHHSKSPSV